MTTIDLMRHGAPIGGRMYRGSGTDHPLSASGWQQMYAALTPYNNPWDVIISSPMQRCYAFASQLAEQLQRPCVVQDHFKEAFYGEWEGKTHQAIQAAEPDAFAAFYRDPVNCRPANAESLVVFYERVTHAFTDILENFADQQVLMIAHAGVMRCIMTNVLQAPLASQQRVSIPYAGMYRVQQTEQGLTVTLR